MPNETESATSIDAASVMAEVSRNQFTIPAEEATKQAEEATKQAQEKTLQVAYRLTSYGIVLCFYAIAMARETNGSSKWLALTIGFYIWTAAGAELFRHLDLERRKRSA